MSLLISSSSLWTLFIHIIFRRWCHLLCSKPLTLPYKYPLLVSTCFVCLSSVKKGFVQMMTTPCTTCRPGGLADGKKGGGDLSLSLARHNFLADCDKPQMTITKRTTMTTMTDTAGISEIIQRQLIC